MDVNTLVMVEVNTDWKRVCALDEIPVLGARVVSGDGHDDIAVFRTADDGVFAVRDKCPHKGGPLSQGIVHGNSVTCPLHSWKIRLEDGQAEAPDVGCTHSFNVKVEHGTVFLQL